MLKEILSYDSYISNILAELFPQTPLFEIIFSFLSLNGLTFIVWLLLLAIYLLYKEKKDKAFITYFLLSFLTTSFLVNVVLKNIFQRERPYIAKNLSEVTCPNDFSFPSGHAAGAFAGAVIFARFDPKRRWGYYILAILISYSRIYLHCHFLLDITFGALTGYSVGKLYVKGLASRIKI